MRVSTAESYQERILRVLVYIETNLEEDLELETLARVACFSPYHFHRIFRGVVGESVKEHVRRLRLERAARRLRGTGQPVTAIALEAGFEAHESFTRAFHAQYGQAPSAYRAMSRPAVPPESRVEARVENLAPMEIVFARHVGPYDQVGEAWGRLMGFAAAAGLFRLDAKMFGIAHDDPEVTDPERLRYDAAIAATAPATLPAGFGARRLDGGLYAAALHAGPYDRLFETYARLCGEWLPQSGYETRPEPSLEFYRNNPQNAKPEELRTEIWLPVV